MSLFPKIQTFMQWWRDGLYDSLPDATRKLFRTELPRLILQMRDDQHVDVSWQQDGKRQSRGAFSLHDAEMFRSGLIPEGAQNKPHQVELCLGKSQVLHLQHHFPEAVKENLQQVVGYQLDRLTPFTAENTYFDTRVAAHDKGRKEILADIYVTPKHVVDKFSRELQDVGLGDIHHVTVQGAASGVQLMGQAKAGKSQGWSHIPLYFFLGALAFSLLAPMAYKYRRLDQIETALADLRHSSADQLAVRDKLMEAEDALKFLEEKRKTSPVALDVVEKLSADIPDHTWLERLTITGNKLEIRGESGKALTLIDLLEDAPEFSDVRFKSPVVRNKENGRDKFHIEATLEVPHAE
jgi:general secretion pathway protein L